MATKNSDPPTRATQCPGERSEVNIAESASVEEATASFISEDVPHGLLHSHQAEVSQLAMLAAADTENVSADTDTSSSDDDLYSHAKENPPSHKKKQQVISGRSNGSKPSTKSESPYRTEAGRKKHNLPQKTVVPSLEASTSGLMQTRRATAGKRVEVLSAPVQTDHSMAVVSAVRPPSTKAGTASPVRRGSMKRAADPKMKSVQVSGAASTVNRPRLVSSGRSDTPSLGNNGAHNSLALASSSFSAALELIRHPPMKGPENRVAVNYKKAYTHIELREIRWKRGNPYITCPRDATDPRFYTLIQQDYYETVVTGLDTPVVPQKTIDWNFIRANEQHFQGVEQACMDRNVFGLTEFKQDWCEEVILQFYATLYIDDDKTMWWMTNGKRYTCTFQEFALFLGFASFDKDEENQKTRIHAAKGSLSPSELSALYPASALQKPDYVRGSIKYMLPLPLTLSRIFRRTIAPKLGDSGSIRRWAANLVMQFHKQEDFQVVDFIFNELKNASADKSRCLPFAPFIQRVVNEITKLTFKYDRIHESYKPPIPGEEFLSLETTSDGSGNTGNTSPDATAPHRAVSTSGCCCLDSGKFDKLLSDVSFLKSKIQEWGGLPPAKRTRT